MGPGVFVSDSRVLYDAAGIVGRWNVLKCSSMNNIKKFCMMSYASTRPIMNHHIPIAWTNSLCFDNLLACNLVIGSSTILVSSRSPLVRNVT